MIAVTPPAHDAPRAAHLEMVEALLSGQGLLRVAAIAAREARAPVAIAIPRLGEAVVHPPEAADAAVHAALGAHLAGGAAPSAMTLSVPIRAGDETWGVVALLGDGAERASEFLHVAAVAALTEVAIAEARAEAEDDLRGSFVEEVRLGRLTQRPDIVRGARRLGCDLAGGAIALCAQTTGGRPRHLAVLVAGELPGALTQVVGERVHVVLGVPGDAEDPEDARAAVRATARALAERLQADAVVGVSSLHARPEELRRALDEAELLLDVARNGGPGARDAAGQGAYRLLARVLASHPDELRAFYEDTVGPLVRYDDQYRTDLRDTLAAYLGHDCNMNATAAAIHAHRHTVAYRLDRVRELTRLDPARSADRERLGLGLKAHELIAPRLPR